MNHPWPTSPGHVARARCDGRGQESEWSASDPSGDVAAHVGVSRSTASLVLRGSPLVAEETSVKVLEACKELGYVYNRAASSLRAQRTDSVGLVVTSVGNPFLQSSSTVSNRRWQ